MTQVIEKQTNLRNFEKVCSILEKFDYNPDKLIPILQAVQEEYRFLPEEVLSFLSVTLDLPPAHVFGVATFYAHFALKPKGKFVIKVCDGTACHVKNSIPIVEALFKQLNLTYENNTSQDMRFTVETVSCLGACGLAPVVVVNEEVHPLMTPEKMEAIVKEIIALEEQNGTH
ncbi:MAG TPA: NAD(P)H-dependent oxidoreductase subunit E [Ignavibacteriaceae bacterium]|jgi:NADH-quinone oxidoreductase subunit E|nr:NAD(P)H-dependent oxidoreductase subunit E [Ignavibacteriaceae bacterium]